MKNTSNYKKRICLYIVSFAIGCFMTLSILQKAIAFFGDVFQGQADGYQTTSATLVVGASDFKINNATSAVYYGHDIIIDTIGFKVKNNGYDDAILTNTLIFTWDDTATERLTAGELLLYPEEWTDDQIKTDILNNSHNNAVAISTVDTDGASFLVINEDNADIELKGTQSLTVGEEKIYEYKLATNHVLHDISYSGGQVMNVTLSVEGKYQHRPEIAWDSTDDANILTLTFNSSNPYTYILRCVDISSGTEVLIHTETRVSTNLYEIFYLSDPTPYTYILRLVDNSGGTEVLIHSETRTSTNLFETFYLDNSLSTPPDGTITYIDTYKKGRYLM